MGMKVLVTGISSLMGKYLLLTVPNGVDGVDGTWYTNPVMGGYQMDVCENSQVRYVVGKVRPDAIIHMAAIGSVDYCERNYTEAERTIVRGTVNVLNAAREYASKVVYMSTNAVYRGDNPPYKEDSNRQPVNRYGAFRKRAEDLVANYKHDWAIVRLFMLYGEPPEGARTNWVVEVVRRLRNEERVRLVDDRWWMPTFAGDAAKVVWKVTGQETGFFNVAGPDRVTLKELGQRVAAQWGLDPDMIDGIPSDPEWTPRPVDSSYDLTKAGHHGLTCQGLSAGLADMRSRHEG